MEVIGIIGKKLIEDGAYGGCAALNVTCQAVYEETLRTLWRTVVHWGVKALDKLKASTGKGMARFKPPEGIQKELNDSWQLLINSRGAKYIEYVSLILACIEP